ncbi:hypothetical protein BGX27_003295 [Mortierella sp. AM989]|nr:hypothetical protein BGX27_003295 [Mortierella sp. AM989]
MIKQHNAIDQNNPVSTEHLKFFCSECSKSFDSKEAVRTHFADYHDWSISISIEDKIIQIERDSSDRKFHCSACDSVFETKGGLHKHVKRKGDCRAKYCIAHEVKRRVTEEISQSAPRTLTAKLPPIYREYDDAVLHASGAMFTSPQVKIHMLAQVESMGYFPIAMSDERGKELNLLATEEVRNNISSNPRPFFVWNISQKNKRKWEIENQCLNCTPLPLPEIDDLLETSLYAALIRKRTYIEISSDVCKNLNVDWTRRPQSRYACGQYLAGAILLRMDNREAVIINSVEVYGRTSWRDVHREPFGVVKGHSTKTSLPAVDGRDHYKDVRPTTMTTKDGKKLVIGTGTCDILVTCCTRLDPAGNGLVSVGGNNSCFLLESDEAIRNIRIFLDHESEQAGHDLMKCLDATEISETHGIKQMRQLRTRFDEPSTFSLCRVSGPLTRHHVYWPYTVFTVATHDQCRSGGTFAIGILFIAIGEAVMISATGAVLRKDVVVDLRQKCAENSTHIAMFDDILSLYEQGIDTIPILRNKALNKSLEVMADALSSKISLINEIVATYIKDCFLGKTN